MAKIIINSTELPNAQRPDAMIRWFCIEFGISGDNESNTIGEHILREFAVAAQKGKGLTSSELATSLNMVMHPPVARSTVIYHLNRFIEIGLIVKKGRQYFLRATEMTKTIEEIEYDMQREMQKMIDAAKQFDQLMQNMFGVGFQNPPQQQNNERKIEG